METSPGDVPWFERVMNARRDPVWVAYALFMTPGVFLNVAMVIAAFDMFATS